MDLWIRSQDKTRLSIITNIQLVECDGEYSLVGYTNDYVDDFDLGTYKSKERALEVLAEIQDLFKLNIQNETFERADLLIKARMLPVVYEMPKE